MASLAWGACDDGETAHRGCRKLSTLKTVVLIEGDHQSLSFSAIDLSII
jgi:hypothetical protein